MALDVFDLPSEELAREILSLGRGTTIPSNIVGALWTGVWRVSPALLGGCRPVDLEPLLDGWTIDHATVATPWAVPSQVVIARRR